MINFQYDHSNWIQVAIEKIVGLAHRITHRTNLLRWIVDVHIVVWWVGIEPRVTEQNEPFLVDQNVGWGYGLVWLSDLSEVLHTHDTAVQYVENFLVFEMVFSDSSLDHLVSQILEFGLEQEVGSEQITAVALVFFEQIVFKPYEILAFVLLLLLYQVLYFPLLNLIIGREFSEHVLATSSFFLDIHNAIERVSLNDRESLVEALKLFILRCF